MPANSIKHGSFGIRTQSFDFVTLLESESSSRRVTRRQQAPKQDHISASLIEAKCCSHWFDQVAVVERYS